MPTGTSVSPPTSSCCATLAGSRFAAEINADNWTDILGRKGVVWGHSDPNLDPCGYRSLMVLQLAEKFTGQAGLSDRLLANRPMANVRPKSVELVSLLKTGNMDYAWEYLSVAVQHGLKYVTLDDHINLGNYKFDQFYAQAQVKVSGKKPGTWITRTGKSCTYGITLIKGRPQSGRRRGFHGLPARTGRRSQSACRHGPAALYPLPCARRRDAGPAAAGLAGAGGSAPLIHETVAWLAPAGPVHRPGRGLQPADRAFHPAAPWPR